jgi:NADH-quinone oxidoreductase subunit A
MFNYEFSSLLIYVVSSGALVILMALVTFFLSPVRKYRDKVAPYECGFHPFEDARKEFNVHFYLVALLFVAFDLEVIFLVPWAVGLIFAEPEAYWSVLSFLALVLAGFVYEWKRGALSW